MATAHRFRADSMAQRPAALGSYGRRVWNEEFDRLMRPLRASNIRVPREVSGDTYSDWQKLLDDAWAEKDGATAQASAQAVIRQAVVLREALAELSRAYTEPPDAVAALITALQIVKEIILDADLLNLRDSGSITEMEEFVARYPDGPYTGTVLFAIGNLHEDRQEKVEAKDAYLRMLRAFPDHPLYREAYTRMQAL